MRNSVGLLRPVLRPDFGRGLIAGGAAGYQKVAWHAEGHRLPAHQAPPRQLAAPVGPTRPSADLAVLRIVLRPVAVVRVPNETRQ